MLDAAATPPSPAVPSAVAASRTSAALDNLRAVVILIVLAFHSMLAYLRWVPVAGAGFDVPPYAWRAFPILDRYRFAGFDLFCAWQNVDLMALLFFLSGLFVWNSLERKKDWGYLRDRVMRLGVPYVFGVMILIPIAIYPAYRVTASDPALSAYWRSLVALPFWPNGPLWFLWQLLALNVAAGAIHAVTPGAIAALGRWSAAGARDPLRYAAGFLAVSALAYVPMAFAFTPWAWSDSGPFAVQFCRPPLYAVYFFAGVGVGRAGLERGLLAVDGVLARHWGLLLTVALGALALWIALTALTMNGTGAGIALAADLSFVPACLSGGGFLIAVCLRFLRRRSRFLGTLAANAFGLYIVHYLFVVWLQFALLELPLYAVIKAAIVFAGTLSLSLATVAAARRLGWGARLIGATPRAALS